MLVLAVAGFRLFPEKDVTVLNDGQSFRVSATLNTQQEALAAAEIALEPGDRVVQGSGGRYVSYAVQRARPVMIEADGKTLALRTRASTIAGALADAGVELRPGDRVTIDGQLATPRGPLVPTSLYVSRLTPDSAAASSGEVKVQVTRARPITVFVDTLRVDTLSAAPTVQDVLGELGMIVREIDLVRPGLDARLSAGETVRIARARAVTVKIDGKEQTLYTLASTVADVVRVLGLTLGPADTVVPDFNTPIINGSAVTIATTRVVEESEDEVIEPGIVDVYDPAAAAGSTRIVQGVAGVRRNTYRVTYENGEKVGKPVLIASDVLKPAVITNRIIGTKPAPNAKPTLNVDNGAGAAGYHGVYKRSLVVIATYYNPAQGAWEPGSPHYGTTASGMQAGRGVCAVDPRVIPLGTNMYIPGYGPCIAGDTGGEIRGNHVDVGFPDGEGAWWGRRTLEIYILD